MTLELTEEITFSLPFSPMPLTLCETLSCFLWVPFPGLSHNVFVSKSLYQAKQLKCIPQIEFLRLVEVA